MKPPGSITGPIVLILIGFLFLAHAISPAFQIGEWIAADWPYLLILWGGLQFLEVCFRFVSNRSLPVNGVSGGAWLLVVLICLAGLVASEVRRPNQWWRLAGFEKGVEAFGEEHEFSFDPLQRSVGSSPHVVIESFRGDAKVIGTDDSQIMVSGRKAIRAFNESEAGLTNEKTPVELLVQGNTIIVRCHQDRAQSRTSVETNLEILVPKNSSMEATGTRGDFDVSALSGSVDISSENAGVRLQNVNGSVKIDTRRSDLIRCTDVNGTVDLRGHGTDVELTKVTGPVSISGSYSGSVSLRSLEKPVKVANMRTEFSVQQVSGEIRLEHGSINMQNVIGPTRLNTHAMDISLENFTNGLELDVDRGDVELRPGHVPLGKMSVHTRSGNIELTLPQTAAFVMAASTDRGNIDNEFGDTLKETSEGRGAKLTGMTGTGPDVTLITQRGKITVRKTTSSEQVAAATTDKPLLTDLH